MLSKMLAFAVGLGAAAAWDGGLSLRHPTPAFAAPAAAALFADKTADGRGSLCTAAPALAVQRAPAARLTPLMMGRAAAVRAATKGKADAAKAKLNARYGKQIQMAVKSGGPDPVANRLLDRLITQAKAAGVPKTNIDNILKKASAKDAANFEEKIYEAYAHGGAGMIIVCLTDNNNRCAADVKTVMNRQKLKPAESGSVLFNFDKLGQITVMTDKDEDGMMEIALEAGADDLAALDGDEKGFYVYTDPSEMAAVADAIRESGLEVKDAVFTYKGKAPVPVSEADEELNFKAMDAFEELDDVDVVFSNME